MNEPIILRPLGKLMNLIEETGYKLEYQFDDLVFVDNTAFLFRFDSEQADFVLLHFNVDCEAEAKEKLSKHLLEVAKIEDVKLVLAENFRTKQIKGKEELQIEFIK